MDIEGVDAALALMQGTSADLSANSPPRRFGFMGLTCLLLRTQGGFRLHVERSWLEALLSWLDEA